MTTDNRTNEPNKYAAFLARQNHQRDPWRGVGAKCLCGKVFELDADHALHQVDEILRAALVAAASAAPVHPSSTVDEAALIREAKAEALEEKGYFLKGQAEWTRSNFLPGPHSDACAKYNDEIGDELIEDAAELRARAAEYREGSET